MTKKPKPPNKSTVKVPKPKSDGLFKRIMEDKVAAKEFLNAYLPDHFKDMVDLDTIKCEKESYVEPNLRKQLSDVVFKITSKDDSDELFAYVLVEHQSKSDPLIALRLWRYMLLLCERHSKNKGKLPLVMPLVFYHGKEKYTAARDLWQLFIDPVKAKELMTNEYQLIDLQAMSDDDIKRKQHLGMLEFFFKHIHQKNMLKLWEEFLHNFAEAILIDRENGYVYIKQLVWYTDFKVPEEQKQQLNDLIIDNLPDEEGEQVMRSIAQAYIEEGYENGIEKGIERGIEKGIEKGIERGIEKTALRMLNQNMPVQQIANFTGLPITQILKLKESF